jgi:hypothetical protein
MCANACSGFLFFYFWLPCSLHFAADVWTADLPSLIYRTIGSQREKLWTGTVIGGPAPSLLELWEALSWCFVLLANVGELWQVT